MYPEIMFPNLGIEIEHLSNVAINIFGISVYWYGIFIGLAFFLGMTLGGHNAKRFGIKPDVYLDYIFFGFISAIVGARLYYVAFSWDFYRQNLIQIFNLRNGGLAIYGGIIGGFLSALIYCKRKKLNFFELSDYIMPGLALGQAIGRWGNFFNKEAFGGYTDGLFAMAIRTDVISHMPDSIVDKIYTLDVGDAYSYAQVQPTFLYESFWNVMVCIFLYYWSKKKKFHGHIFYLYFMLYGVGRFIIESFRTDQLIIGSTGIPVSMLLSFSFVLISIVMIFVNIRRVNNSNNK
ncbi:MAG: prolipoprotein diacylglyceryl transferase [Lachnospirales bacterium]